MNSKRLFLTLAALASLTLVGTNCTLVYRGCEKDSDCDQEAGEICIEAGGTSECGLPATFCEEGRTDFCEPQAYDPAELTAADGDRTGLTARGECASKMQVCNASGEWVQCREPEACDGLDNDCNGLTDDGIEGVGEACSAGDGVCRRTGNQVCETDGTLSCNAVAGPPEEPACDCLDNNCDGIINDFELATDANATAPAAGNAAWSMATLGENRYAAVANGAGGIDLLALDSADTPLLVSIPDAADPRLFPSELNQTLVVFFVRSAETEVVGTFQDEVHVASVLASTGEVLAERCLSCADPARAAKGGAIGYDVAFFGLDTDGNGIFDPDDTACGAEPAGACGYVATFIRATEGTLYTAEADAVTLEYAPNTEGIALNFPDKNSAMSEVRFVAASPTLGFLGFVRETSPGMSEIVLASALIQGRVQVSITGTVVPVFDPAAQDFDLAVLPDGQVLLVTSSGATVELQLLEQAMDAADFDPIYPAPAVIEPDDPTSAASVSNPQVVHLCNRPTSPGQQPQPEYAMIAYEVADATGNRTIEALLVNRRDGLPTFRPEAATPGTWPLLERIDDQIVLGALIDGDGSGTVTAATPLTPSIDELTCDP